MTAATELSRSTTHEGIRETLESIIVALILAFVFRAFIVEAFIIPTGSMAPTLYGAHGTILCDNCGTELAYGLTDLSERRAAQSPIRASASVACPNCGYHNTDLRINDESRNAESGDRILVLKWPFDISDSWFGPARWDVTVFKNPTDGTQNYIKRLVGLPNEVLLIMDGDVYTVPIAELSSDARSDLERIVEQKHQLLATDLKLRRGMDARFSSRANAGKLRRVTPRTLDELDGKMRIARKTEIAQKALWFVHYDHDYPPEKIGLNQPTWLPQAGPSSGWNASTRRVQFRDRGIPADALELRGRPVLASYAYNISRPGYMSTPPAPPVSDLQVSFVLTPKSESGAISIRLEKHERVFWAAVNVNGRVSIHESNDLPTAEEKPMLSRTLPALRPGVPLAVSFENLDYRLALRIGDEEVLATDSENPDAPDFYAPDLRLLRQRKETQTAFPQLVAAGGDFDLTHLIVRRDIHYYRPDMQPGPPPWAPASGWGAADNPILLRAGEYFMLGDNSAASQDSRLWGDISANLHLAERGSAYQLGTVPRDQLLGKAFFVYWPMGHRIDWLPGLDRWGIIPDVGRMRWIR